MIHVLFVDDEWMLLNLAKELLEQKEVSFKVDTAPSAKKPSSSKTRRKEQDSTYT